MRGDQPQILAIHLHRAARLGEAHDSAYGRGLAGAVPPDERGGRARLQREADVAQYWRIRDGDVDVFESQHRRHIPITCSRTFGSAKTSAGVPSFWILPTFQTATRWA